jgi:hypothetical protein
MPLPHLGAWDARAVCGHFLQVPLILNRASPALAFRAAQRSLSEGCLRKILTLNRNFPD